MMMILMASQYPLGLRVCEVCGCWLSGVAKMSRWVMSSDDVCGHC